MINVTTKHFEYRIRKVFVGQDGKSDCEVQRKYKDGWGLVENRRVRRVLAEIALKRQGGCQYELERERIQRLREKNGHTTCKRKTKRAS